ncbi:MAG: tetratricopeptide repeat protein [Bryobacteraceae bacterium]
MGQATDLAPLLPAATAASQGIREALMAGDLARVTVLVDNLPETDRDLWRGILAIVRNDSTAAIRALRRMGHPKALGVAYYLARQHVLFREQMAEAIRKTPHDFGPYYYLGRHYDSDVDNAEEAAKWFRLALERNSGYTRARFYLGNCLERTGQLAEAEAEYMASLTVAQSLVGLARLRLGEGNAAAALEFVKKAMEMDSRDAAAPKLAARIYGALDRPRDSIRAMETAAVLAPRDATVRYQLWRTYQAAGEAAKAAAALSEFERLRAIYGMKP